MDLDDDETSYYEVETIRDKRTLHDGTKEYLIKWKNYSESYNTWEPEDNLNCPSILAEFESNLAKQKAANKINKIKKEKKEGQDQLVKEKHSLSSCQSGTTVNKEFNRLINNHENDFLSSTSSSSSSKQKQKQQISARSITSLKNNMNNSLQRSGPNVKSDSGKASKYKDPAPPVVSSKTASQTPSSKSLAKTPAKFTSIKRPPVVTAVQPTVDIDTTLQKILESKEVKQKQKVLSGSFKPSQYPVTTPLDRASFRPKETYRKDTDHIKQTDTARIGPSNPPYVRTSPVRATSQPSIQHSPVQQLPVQHPSVQQSFVQPLVEAKPSQAPPFQSQQKVSSNPGPLAQHRQPLPLHPYPKMQPPAPTPPSHPQRSSQSLSMASSTRPTSNLLKHPQQQLVPNLQMQVSPQLQQIQTVNRPADPRLELANLKRLAESRDPRLNPQKKAKLSTSLSSKVAVTERMELTPLTIDAVLCKNDDPITSAVLNGNEMCFHKDQIQKLIAGQAKKPNHIHIVSYFPLKTLDNMICESRFSLIKVNCTGSLVDAGVAYDSDSTNQILAFLPVGNLHKLSNLPADADSLASNHQLYAIYLDNIPSKVHTRIDMLDLAPKGDHLSFSWEKAITYLRFPSKLKQLKKEAKFIVYGHSECASLLTKAITKLKPVKNPKIYVMMFDRCNEVVFSRTLTRHKKEPSSQIWEFGVPNAPTGKIQPLEQVFPNHSGGLVTTDAENILISPFIIDVICEQIEKLNSDAVSNGHWKFILPHDIFSLLKTAKSERMKEYKLEEAVIRLSLALSNDKIAIIKLWSTESQKMDSVRFMDIVIRNYYKKHQFFVYVDDVYSVPRDDRLHCIDFVKSTEIAATFK
ncbi:hypothetical protein G6F37_009837 [Rhizopus arrhizus]|nr:hypothetical protein G6F38_009241 [Rhizopus arrhizus]KAG1154016.1 hypothetical protein G6F37_009837 [Rhizopus arrhizus]